MYLDPWGASQSWEAELSRILLCYNVILELIGA